MSFDMTVVFYTANMTSPYFSANVQRLLLKAIGDMPLISVSQEEMPDFGRNICIGRVGQSYLGIYRQMLIGAKAAETKWVALVEDDMLFPPSHFTTFLPPDDHVAYDTNKWKIYTWVTPPVFQRNPDERRYTTGGIMRRDVLVDALEERFAKYPDAAKTPLHKWGEIGRYERALGVTQHPIAPFAAPDPYVVFFHEASIGYQIMGSKKRSGKVRCDDIPYWGRAADIMRLHYGSGIGDVPVIGSHIIDMNYQGVP